MNTEAIKSKLLSASTPEAVYETLMELGKTLSPLPIEDKTKENLVIGCQSVMYCKGELKDGRLFFECDSEALISKGIAALLVAILSGKTPEEILKDDLKIIQELKLPLLLSPSRSNGLKSLQTKMKQIALSCLLKAR